MKYPKYKYFLAFLDFIVLLAAFFLSDIVWGALNGKYSFTMARINPVSVGVYVFAAIVSIFIFQANNLYKIDVFLAKSRQLILLIKSVFYSLLLLVIISFFLKFQFISSSRLNILLLGLFSTVMVSAVRIIFFRGVFSGFAKSRIFKRNTIVIGGGKAARTFTAKVLLENNYGIRIIGFVDDSLPAGTEILSKFPVMGKIHELSYICERYKVHEVIIAIDNIEYERLLEIIDTAKMLGVSVKLTSELFSVVTEKVPTEKYSGIPLVDVAPKINEKTNLVLKRVVDVILASIGIIILSPLFTLIAALIKLSSPGPVFYKSYRVGKDGKLFEFLKFRSMTMVEDDKDEEREKMMIEFMKNDTRQDGSAKIINESRVTSIGKFIRKTSLDELPQLINVIRGEMSLVGPRPCLPYEYENFDHWQKRRTDVLPGCTGVWQVAGRGDVSFNDSVILDLYYINNMAPWLDLQIILKTIPVMILAKGAK